MTNQEFKYKYTDRTIGICLYVVSLMFSLVFVLRLNIPTMVDEVGTLGNAALLMGYDWSETLFAQGGCYFKYGYALFYYPLMRIFTDSYKFYKACLVLNVAINSFIPVIANTVLRKYFNRGRVASAFMGLAVYVLPSAFLYSLYTKADSILIFLPWLMTLIILRLMRLTKSGRDTFVRIVLSIALAFLGVFSFMAHTRGIVNYIALVLTIVLISAICETKTVSYIAFVLSSVAFFVLDSKLSDYFKSNLFGVYGTRYSSVESYDFETLKLLFTRDGMADFVKNFAGTAYNVLASTWGLAAIAVFGGLILIIRFIRSKSTATPEETAAAIFIWLCFVGTFAMSCLYFFPYVSEYLHGDNPHRADWLVYGRYTGCASGPAVMLALHLLTRKPQPVTGKKHDFSLVITVLLSAAFYAGVFILFKEKVSPYIDGISAVSRNFIQLCTFLEVGSYGITTAVFDNLCYALGMAGMIGFGGLCVFTVLAVIRRASSNAASIVSSIIFIIAGVVLIVINYDKIRISRDEILMSWTVEPCTVLEEIAEKSDIDERYNILVDSSAKSIKHYQFVCKEYMCGCGQTETADDDNMFIIAKKKYFLKDYYDNDYYIFDSFNYEDATKDIVYIKGEKLAQELKALGYSISPYEGKFKKSPEANNDI